MEEEGDDSGEERGEEGGVPTASGGGAQRGILLEVLEASSPASEMSFVEKPRSSPSSTPTLHTQQGSPSSIPLLCPSLSVSARQRAVVHALPSSRKANRKAVCVGLLTLCPVSLPLTRPLGTSCWKLS